MARGIIERQRRAVGAGETMKSSAVIPSSGRFPAAIAAGQNSVSLVRVDAGLLDTLDLSHPPFMDGDLHGPEADGGYLAADNFLPGFGRDLFNGVGHKNRGSVLQRLAEQPVEET